MQDVDLPKREPFFGSGALPLLGQLLGTAFGIGLLILIMFLGAHVKGMMFESHATTPSKAAIEAEMKRRGLPLD